MADDDVGKLFVGGISRETTEDTLKEHFSKYGVVSSAIIAKDRLTNTPRGFGFVTFFDPSSLNLVLQDHHVISGRTVEVKKAIPRNRQHTNSQREQLEQQNQQSYFPQGGPDLGLNSNGIHRSNNGDQYLRTKKIFVGGLSANLTEEEFKSYFEQFGRITDVVVMHDSNTNRPRGFGFITFDSEQVVENIMQNSHHELAGKRVDVKRAVPREASRNSNNGNSSRYNGGRYSPVLGYKANHFSPRGAGYGGYPATHDPFSNTSYRGFYYNGVYNGGYPVGGYGYYGYGVPMVAPQSSWNGFGAMGVRPMAYGTGYYPTNVNGVAMMGMVNPYNIFEPPRNGESHRNLVGNNHAPSNNATTQVSGVRSDVDGSSFKPGKRVVNVRKNSQAQSK